MMTFRPLFIGVFESALNRFLALDSDARFLIAPLTGKVIGIRVKPFDVMLFFCPSDDGIQLLDAYPGTVDALLTGTALAFGAKGLKKKLPNNPIEITGNQDIGVSFLNLFESLDIDFEESLSHFTGDIIAHRLGRFFRTGRQRTDDLLVSFRLNVKEFLQEEARDLPAKPEADIFYRKIDDTEKAISQLQTRLQHLENSGYSQDYTPTEHHT